MQLPRFNFAAVILWGKLGFFRPEVLQQLLGLPPCTMTSDIHQTHFFFLFFSLASTNAVTPVPCRAVHITLLDASC